MIRSYSRSRRAKVIYMLLVTSNKLGPGRWLQHGVRQHWVVNSQNHTVQELHTLGNHELQMTPGHHPRRRSNAVCRPHSTVYALRSGRGLEMAYSDSVPVSWGNDSPQNSQPVSHPT
jgi:hypothetical protein